MAAHSKSDKCSHGGLDRIDVLEVFNDCYRNREPSCSRFEVRQFFWFSRGTFIFFAVVRWNQGFIGVISYFCITTILPTKWGTLSCTKSRKSLFLSCTVYFAFTNSPLGELRPPIVMAYVPLSVNGTVELLTKGDNNQVDDRGIYPPGQDWLSASDVIGRAKGSVASVFCSILLNAFPVSKVLSSGWHCHNHHDRLS